MSAAVLASTDEWRRKTGPDVVLHRFDDLQCSPALANDRGRTVLRLAPSSSHHLARRFGVHGNGLFSNASSI